MSVFRTAYVYVRDCFAGKERLSVIIQESSDILK